MNELESKVTQLTREKDTYTRQLEEVQAINEGLPEQIDALEAQRNDAEGRVFEITETLAEVSKDLEEKDRDLLNNSYSNRMADMRIQNQSTDMEKISAQIAKYEALLERDSAAMEKSLDRQEELSAQKFEIEDQYTELLRENRELKEEHSDRNTEIQRIKNKNRVLETRLEKLEGLVNDRENKLGEHGRKFDGGEEQVELLKAKIIELEERVETETTELKDLKTSRDEQVEAMNELLSSI